MIFQIPTFAYQSTFLQISLESASLTSYNIKRNNIMREVNNAMNQDQNVSKVRRISRRAMWNNINWRNETRRVEMEIEISLLMYHFKIYFTIHSSLSYCCYKQHHFNNNILIFHVDCWVFCSSDSKGRQWASNKWSRLDFGNSNHHHRSENRHVNRLIEHLNDDDQQVICVSSLFTMVNWRWWSRILLLILSSVLNLIVIIE